MMKKALTLLSLMLLSYTSFSQNSPFFKFFGPVDRSVYETTDTLFIEFRDIDKTKFWLVRPALRLNAMEINLLNGGSVRFLNTMGVGASYAHFREENGQPYQDFAADFVILFGATAEPMAPLELSLAASITAWQYLSIGIGYNFKEKYPFLLTGITYSFNK